MAIPMPKYRYVSEPHKLDDPASDCECPACEGYRAERIIPGCLARPAFNQKAASRMPWWRLETWRHQGWNWENRFKDSSFVMVVGDIPREDNDSLVGAVLCMSSEYGLIVTSKRWLVRLDLPYVRPV